MECFHKNDASFCAFCLSFVLHILSIILPVLFLFMSAHGTPINETDTNLTCRDDEFIDCRLADDKHNICVQRTLAAVKLCQKYCGYCTADGYTMPPPSGTTIDTCVDNGDIDCKQMNDTLHICVKKDSPPTLLYCPKFCGLCTSSSVGNTNSVSTISTLQKDEFYMNCKLADDYHNICSERNLAAVKYCPKYCGYCTDALGSTQPMQTATDSCLDIDDIDCKEMNDSLHICALKEAPPTVLYCPKFCGLCSPSSGRNETLHVTTTTSSSALSNGVSLSKIISSTSTQSASTIPITMTTKSSLQSAATTSPPPKTLPSVTTHCEVCSGPQFLCENLFEPKACPPPNNYCINSITNYRNGTKSVIRACGNFDTCYREWYIGTSDEDKCRNYDGSDRQFLDFQCTFCCIHDNCNSPLRPPADNLYKPN